MRYFKVNPEYVERLKEARRVKIEMEMDSERKHMKSPTLTVNNLDFDPEINKLNTSCGYRTWYDINGTLFPKVEFRHKKFRADDRAATPRKLPCNCISCVCHEAGEWYVQGFGLLQRPMQYSPPPSPA